ncbi:hypothetical protein ABVK25_001880 [Lepraria finkii]|uniref:Uncharacterized protein n=1 Tax=Lepraria finkii TaxID=1340010 RepID=A0ABR4BLG5_9LECA
MVAGVATSRNHVKPFVVIGVLTDVLKSKCELHGNIKDLLRAIEISEEIIEQASPTDEGAAGFLCALSFFHEMKYEHTLDVEDLEWAVYHGENAVAAVPTGHKNYGLHQRNLGDKLSDLCRHTSLKDHLDRATAAAQQAVEAIELERPDRAGYLNKSANCASKISKLSGLRSDADRGSSETHSRSSRYCLTRRVAISNIPH